MCPDSFTMYSACPPVFAFPKNLICHCALGDLHILHFYMSSYSILFPCLFNQTLEALQRTLIWFIPISAEAVDQRCYIKKGVLKNLTKFTGKKTCARVSFFNKVAGLRPATLLKERLWHRCFPVNFVKFLRISFL